MTASCLALAESSLEKFATVSAASRNIRKLGNSSALV
jgi:hypothetical protein